MDKRFRVVMLTEDGSKDFAEAIAADVNAALGLVVNRQTPTLKPHLWKVFDISHGEPEQDAKPELIVRAGWKPGLIPHCDVHPDRENEPRHATARDVIGGGPNTVTIWVCPAEFCNRFFHESLGYKHSASTDQPPETPLCKNHGEFMVVRHGALGPEYACPLPDCNQTEPWYPRAKHTAAQESKA